MSEIIEIPSKSKQTYELTYNTFVDWRKSNNITSTTETVLMDYFDVLSKKYKASSLWSIYSMLKSMISIREKIDIKQYKELIPFLKNNSAGFQSKKSKVFSAEDVQKFLAEATDQEYLATKVACIFGICGACRIEELLKIRVQDITTHGNLLEVTLPDDTKSKKSRSFTIGPEFSKFVKKYLNLRPKETSSDRFFINYQKGKCTNQVIGKNKFAILPKQIATYLNLPDSEAYTGHSFRRTSTILLYDSDEVNITTLKRHGNWKSSSSGAVGSIEQSIQNEAKIENLISSALNNFTSESHEEFETFSSKRQKMNESNFVESTSSNDNSPNERGTFLFVDCNTVEPR